MKPRHPFAFLFAVACLAMLVTAQQRQPGTTKDDEDVVKAGKEDPFTKQDPELMKKAGIVSYGPFPWAD